jgi:hypothetical protein
MANGTANINRTFGTPTDNLKWTWSAWVKASMAQEQGLFHGYVDGSNYAHIELASTGQFKFYNHVSGGASGAIRTTRFLRDPFSWYHLVFVFDSAQSTDTNRMKMYINGLQQTGSELTSVTYPTQSAASKINGAWLHQVGMKLGGYGFAGEMSHIHFCDGQAYAASDFGSFNATDGMWEINTSPTVTYGNNGYFLKMEDSSNLDLDSSSNGATFATTGTLTSTKDNPSNNFCTLNPLYGKSDVTYAFTNGNNVLSTSGGSGWHQAMGTLAASSGKWYYEAYANYSPGAYNTQLGFASTDFLALTKAAGAIGAGAYKPSFGLYDVGQLNYSTDSATAQESGSWGSPWTSGDYLMFAVDLDNGRFYYGKNGTWDATSSSNPVAGTGGYSFTPGAYSYTPMMALYYQDIITNFGNGYFTTTSAGATNADDNGYGVFKYDVPAGFYAICTKNINDFG